MYGRTEERIPEQYVSFIVTLNSANALRLIISYVHLSCLEGKRAIRDVALFYLELNVI